VIRDDRWREKARELEPAMAVRRAHHGNFDALIAQSSDTSSPFSLDCAPAFELEAELAKEINRRRKVIDDDSYVVHPFKRHVANLQTVVPSDNDIESVDALSLYRAYAHEMQRAYNDNGRHSPWAESDASAEAFWKVVSTDSHQRVVSKVQSGHGGYRSRVGE
jgi:hypothetical protein